MENLNMYGDLQYDYIFLMNVPVFYKINLLNELYLKKKIFVIFLSKGTNEVRSTDFANSNINFPHVILSMQVLQNRSYIRNTLKILNILRTTYCKELVIGGWDHLEYLITLLVSRKNKSLIVESNLYDQNNSDLVRSFLKKTILSSVSRVIVPGKLNAEYVRLHDAKCKIDYMGTVGVLNPYVSVESHNLFHSKNDNKFIIVSRLVEIKNIHFVFKYFEDNPNKYLDIVGTGEITPDLKKIAPSNVRFLGSLPNTKVLQILPYYKATILPSLKEPWGLVVEESLRCGIPVLCSENAGASELVLKNDVGFLFSPTNYKSFNVAMKQLNDNYSVIKQNAKDFARNFNNKVNPLSVFN